MSPVLERAQSQGLFQNSFESVQWPFEHFPPPPPDGYWIPKYTPPPPSKFPPPLPDVQSNLTLHPPIMALTYPPPPPLTEKDPVWLDRMLADVLRQRSHLEVCITEAQMDVANAYVEAGLSDAELDEERAKMQAFLDMVASVAGNGFVRGILEGVEYTVQEMSKPQGDSDDNGHKSTSPSGSAHRSHLPAA